MTTALTSKDNTAGSLETRKQVLTSKIRQVDEEWLIRALEQLVADVPVELTKETLEDSPGYLHLVGNLEESVDLDKIDQERPRRKFDMVEFKEGTAQLEWEYSFEELLEDLQ